MATKAGVWVDHKQAIVVLMTDAGHAITKVQPAVGKPDRPSSSAHPRHKYTPNDFIADDRLDQHRINDRKKLYDDVLAAIADADALLILGPGEAKGEFQKHIVAKKRRGLTVEVETADKMTDRQLAARVSAHFAKAPARKAAGRNAPAAKSAVLKKTPTKKKAKAAPKATAKAAPVKRAKKSNK